MKKECESCRKKIIKLERKLKSWFKAEKLSAAEGALLADDCLDKLVSKLTNESRKDRLALSILRMKRVARDECIDDFNDDDEGYDTLPKKNKSKKKLDLRYIR